MYVMSARISGNRNGIDWPAVGEPAPADLAEDEIESLLATGHIAEAETESAGADATTDLEALTVAQLRALAAERGVELSGTKKAELVAELIAAAEAAADLNSTPAA